jgi:predicted AlkP superfamily pyrophosphatase or phosphodiesterase
MRAQTLFAVTVVGAGCLFAQGSGGRNRPEQLDKPYVVLVSFDGFANEYLDRFDLPNFQRAIRSGVRADSLVSVFPSLTFPAHYSIVTGLHPEHHGIVSMSFYDQARKQMYDYQSPAVEDGTWYRGEPLWITAEKQGMVSATCYWVGSEAAIDGVRPTYWRKFAEQLKNDERVDTVLQWLRLPDEQRPHFITLYFSDVDGAGHRFGPDSPEVQKAAAEMDHELGRLLDGIDSSPVRDRVYLLLVSDHGMAKVPRENNIPIDDIVDLTGIEGVGVGTMMNLYLDGGGPKSREMLKKINAKLTHGHANLRSEIPAKLHFRADPRIGDVVIIMDEPWRILPPAARTKRDMRVMTGWHGWDPGSRNMQGIFIAGGPGIEKGSRRGPVQMTEIKPMLAKWLGLKVPTGVHAGP